MRPLAFSRPGQFFRGNLHTHSTRSDGALDPAEVIGRYAAEGYDFLCLSDHFVGVFDYPITDTTAFRTKAFTTLLGAELHSGAMSNGDLWHILAVGLPLDFAPSESPHFRPVEGQESGTEVARRARDAGAYVAIAHPHWSGLTIDDCRAIDAAHAVEIYNHGCAVECDRGDGFVMLDLLLSEGRRLDLLATDDAHFKVPDHFGGWVMVKAEENTPEALLSALKDGAHYASQGPEIHNITIEKHHVEVECSAAISVAANAQGTASVNVSGSSMTRARLPLDRLAASPWLRIIVIDAAGRRAWSNPIWWQDDR